MASRIVYAGSSRGTIVLSAKARSENRRAQRAASQQPPLDTPLPPSDPTVEKYTAQVADIDERISAIRARQDEIYAEIQSLPREPEYRGQRNRLFNEDASLTAQRNRLTRDRQEALRDLRRARGQYVKSRREIAEEKGLPFSSPESRQAQLLGIKPEAIGKVSLTTSDVLKGGALDRAFQARRAKAIREYPKNAGIATMTNASGRQVAIASVDLDLARQNETVQRLTGNAPVLQSSGANELLFPTGKRAEILRDFTGNRKATKPTSTPAGSTGVYQEAPTNVGSLPRIFGQNIKAGFLAVFGDPDARDTFAYTAGRRPTDLRSGLATVGAQIGAAAGFASFEVQASIAEALPVVTRAYSARNFLQESRSVTPTSLSTGQSVLRSSFSGQAAIESRVSGISNLLFRSNFKNEVGAISEVVGRTAFTLKASEFIDRQRLSPSEVRFVESPLGKETRRAAYAAQIQSASEKGNLGFLPSFNIGNFEVNPRASAVAFSPLIGQGLEKGAAERGARTFLKSRGYGDYSASRFARATSSVVTSRGYAEVVASIGGVEAVSERFGSNLIAPRFERAAARNEQIRRPFVQLFAKSAPLIGRAGGIEGATQAVVIPGLFREQKFTPKQAAIGGTLGYGAGFLTAGTFGGAVVGLSAKPRWQKALNRVLYVADPYEYPGDITENVITGVATKGLGRAVPEARLARVVTPSISFSPTTSTSSFSPTKTRTFNLGFTPVSTKTNTNTQVAINTKTGTNTNIFTFVPTPSNSFIPTISKTNTNTQTNTQTSTTTTTPTNVNTFVSVPTTVPSGFLFPALPIVPAVGASGFGFARPKRGKKRKYKTSRSALNVVFGVKGIDPFSRDITGLFTRG